MSETISPTSITRYDPAGVEQELVKANVTEAIIANLRKRASEVNTALTTKAEYDAVHAVERDCVTVRTTAVSILKRLRDPAIAFQKALVSKEREIVAEIERIEAPLKRAKEEWNSIAERKLAEDVARHAAMLAKRKERLFAIGFRFDGTKYVLEGFTEIEEADVTGPHVDDLEFGEWLANLEREVQEHRERQEEEERTRRVAAEALVRQQQEEGERQAQVAQEQERRATELARKEAEMNSRILDDRLNQLKAIGGMTLPQECMGFGSEIEQYASILAFTEQEFGVFKDRMADQVQKRNDELEAVFQQQEEARKANEERIAAEAAERAIAEERERVQREREAQEKEKALLARQEAERVAQMGDKEHVTELAVRLRAIHNTLPVLQSEVGKHGMKTLDRQLADIIRMVEGLIRDID